MNNTINYRGYSATIQLNANDKLLYGKIDGINDVVRFHGATLEELQTAFKGAVDDYIKRTRYAALGRYSSFEELKNAPQTPGRTDPDDIKNLFDNMQLTTVGQWRAFNKGRTILVLKGKHEGTQTQFIDMVNEDLTLPKDNEKPSKQLRMKVQLPDQTYLYLKPGEFMVVTKIIPQRPDKN